MLNQDRREPDAAPVKCAGSKPSAEERGTLLIVEDAVIHSTIIAHLADKAGFSSEIAYSYEDACNRLLTRQFDCITLDFGLGDHVGAEVLNHLAKIHSRARIIVVSGSEKAICDEMVRIGRSMDLNVGEPVPKPIDLKLLSDMLSHIRMQSRLEKLASCAI